MERVQCDGHETDGAPAGDCYEDVTFIVGTARSNSLLLIRFPVWVEAEKDVVAHDLPYGGEHGRPRSKRELNDSLKVALMELADLDSTFTHGDRTVAACDYRVAWASVL
jgi:hypothetical protein